jgi:CO/xanthine dehydrogenase Mo-binding subunit
VEGQYQGGVAQGIGWALNEEYAYDDAGHLRNATLLLFGELAHVSNHFLKPLGHTESVP